MAYKIDPFTGQLVPDTGIPAFNYPGMGPAMPPPMPPQAPPQSPHGMPQVNPMIGGQLSQPIQIPEIQMSDADRKQALKMALFNAGTNILSNMGPSRMPVSGAQILGQAGMAGMQGYQQAQQQALERYKTLRELQGKKEFNMPARVDEFLATTQDIHGFDFTTPEGRVLAFKWLGTPEGRKKYEEFVSSLASVSSVPSWIPAGFDPATGDYWSFNRRDPETGNPAYLNMRTQEKRNQPPSQLIATNLKTAPSTVITQGNFTKSAIQRLENMAKYYKPEYVGIVQGRIANVERKLSELPPEQVKFYREFKQLNDDIIRAKEGAVVPEPMVKRLEQFMNDIKQPSANFEAQYDSLTDYVRDQGMNLDESLTGQYMSPFKEKHRKFWENRNSLLQKGRMAPGQQKPSGRTIVKRGTTKDGRKVVKYSDGSIEYEQ